MRLGLISDTHDNVPMIKEAIRRLNELDVSLVLHAGDYVSPFTAKPYSELGAKMIGVHGNNCAEKEKLKEVYAAVGKEIVGDFAEVEADGKRIALLHGHDAALLRSLTAHGCYNVVVHGHDHKAKIAKVGTTFVINPGEVCGYVTGRSSIGVLDTETLEAQIIEL
ncbi:MAG: metallophosphoesterase [Candidatus Bathyarchaeota archaeon]|nr:metallophosphoesterase [Candidatus Bathyarchaeota archaeon]